MRALYYFTIFVPVSLFLIEGCGTTTGNYATTLSFQGTEPASLNLSRPLTSRPMRSAATLTVTNRDGSTAGTLTLTDARAVIKEIKLLRKEDGLSEAEKEEDQRIRLNGPFVIDLLTDTSEPEIPPIDLTAGQYNRIEFKLDRYEDGDSEGLIAESDPLFGKSLYFEGTYTGTTASGAVTDAPFRLTFDFDQEFKLVRSSGSFEVVSSASNPLIVAFRMARWFAFQGMEGAEVDFRDVSPSDGSIFLHKDASDDDKKAYEAIRDAIKESTDFGKDEDGDGHLESSEDEDDDADDGSDN